MTKIRVDPPILRSNADEVTGVGDTTGSIGRSIMNAANGAPSYDGQFGPKVKAIGDSAYSKAKGLENSLEGLGDKLDKKAGDFERADSEILQGVQLQPQFIMRLQPPVYWWASIVFDWRRILWEIILKLFPWFPLIWPNPPIIEPRFPLPVIGIIIWPGIIRGIHPKPRPPWIAERIRSLLGYLPRASAHIDDRGAIKVDPLTESEYGVIPEGDFPGKPKVAILAPGWSTGHIDGYNQAYQDGTELLMEAGFNESDIYTFSYDGNYNEMLEAPYTPDLGQDIPYNLVDSTNYPHEKFESQLAAQIALIQKHRPDVEVVIVGHSQGGMIIPGALNDPRVNIDRVANAISLGSPHDGFLPGADVAHKLAEGYREVRGSIDPAFGAIDKALESGYEAGVYNEAGVVGQYIAARYGESINDIIGNQPVANIPESVDFAVMIGDHEKLADKFGDWLGGSADRQYIVNTDGLSGHNELENLNNSVAKAIRYEIFMGAGT